MTRKAGMLAPIFAVAAIVMVNCPVRVLAQEAAQRLSASDDVATLELSAARRCTGSNCHGVAKRRTAGVHKRRVNTRSHKTVKAVTRTHHKTAKLGTHKPAKIGSTNSHKSGKSGSAAGTHIGAKTTKLGSGPGKSTKMATGSNKSGSNKIGYGPGKVGMQDKNAAASPTALFNKGGAHFNKGMDPANKPDKPNKKTDKPEAKTVIIGLPPIDFPNWKKGDSMPPGWKTEPLEIEPGVVHVVPVPPTGWKPKGDTSPAATQADLDTLNAKVAECQYNYAKEANGYLGMLRALRATRQELVKSGGDASDINAQINDTETMQNMKLQQAADCWPSLFKAWKAAGYKL